MRLVGDQDCFRIIQDDAMKRLDAQLIGGSLSGYLQKEEKPNKITAIDGRK